MPYREKRRRRGKVAVPQIMVHALEMPQAFPCLRIESEKRVGKKIIPGSIRAVEIKDRRSGGNINNPTLFIERHARPVIRRARIFPGIGRPRLITKFARPGYGVKSPEKFAGVNVESTNIARWRRVGLRIPSADNDRILVDPPGTGERDRLRQVVAAEPLAQIDPAFFAEGWDWPACLRIQRVEIIHHPGQDATLMPVAPVRDASRG